MKHTFKDWLLATRPWSFPASSMPVLVTVAWSWSRGYDVNWLFVDQSVNTVLAPLVVFSTP